MASGEFAMMKRLTVSWRSILEVGDVGFIAMAVIGIPCWWDGDNRSFVFITAATCVRYAIAGLAILLWRIDLTENGISFFCSIGNRMFSHRYIAFTDVFSSRIRASLLGGRLLSISDGGKHKLNIPLHMLSIENARLLLSLPQLRIQKAYSLEDAAWLRWSLVLPLVMILCMGMIPAFLLHRYCHNTSDLDRVRARAQALGVYDTISAATIASAVQIRHKHDIAKGILKLKDFLDTTSFNEYGISDTKKPFQSYLLEIKKIEQSWKTSDCITYEQAIDSLGTQPLIIMNQANWFDADWFAIQKFLEIRFMSADQEQIADRASRLCRSIIQFSPDYQAFNAKKILFVLSLRLDEVDDHSAIIGIITQWLKDYSTRLHTFLALEYDEEYRNSQIPNGAILRHSDFWFSDGNFLITELKVRFSREALLNHWLDDYEDLTGFSSYIQISSHPAPYQTSLIPLEKDLKNNNYLPRYSKGAAYNILAAQVILARLQGAQPPNDPYGSTGTPLPCTSVNGWDVTYSAGPDHKMYAGNWKKVVALSARAARQVSKVPVIPSTVQPSGPQR
jgi:hypothetical protein